MQLKFKKLRPQAKLPTKATDGSAGYDLYLAEDHQAITGELIRPIKAEFGVSVEIPEGFVGLLTIRSSLGRHGVGLANGVGVIDSDYRGELLAYTMGYNSYSYKAGERIAQLVVVPVFNGEPVWSEDLSDTERGEGGFGSTGS